MSVSGLCLRICFLALFSAPLCKAGTVSEQKYDIAASLTDKVTVLTEQNHPRLFFRQDEFKLIPELAKESKYVGMIQSAMLSMAEKKAILSTKGAKVVYKIWSAKPSDYQQSISKGIEPEREDYKVVGFELDIPAGKSLKLVTTIHHPGREHH